MTAAVVALGSNVPPRRAAILAGVRELAGLPGSRLVATSRLRETEPVDAVPPWRFMNGACLLETDIVVAATNELLGAGGN